MDLAKGVVRTPGRLPPSPLAVKDDGEVVTLGEEHREEGR